MGDSITVSISGASSPGYFTIVVADNSTGQSSTTVQWYDGPGTSAEWITESVTDENNCAGQCTMTGYDPAVTYNGLNYNAGANPTGVQAETMDQGYGPVSTPSAMGTLQSLMSNGFNTSYTGF